VRNGICIKIRERSVELNTTIDKINEKNINISLIREKIKVLSAALMVYIRIE